MPIVGRTLPEAARAFQKHLQRLLATTITQVPPVLVMLQPANLAFLGFRQNGKPIDAALSTSWGPMGLYIAQHCGSEVRDDGTHELQTHKYAYKLTHRDADDALLRWEYERTRPSADDRWSRHHLQGNFFLDGGGAGSISANELHLPTGFVTIEEVIRFCIVDLGVEPLSSDWNERLDESYYKFKTDFTP